MRLKIFIALLICILCVGTALPALAQIQPLLSRLYFASYLGLNVSGTHDFTNNAAAAQGDAKLATTTSFAGALGLHLSDHFRVEEELSYRKPKFDHVHIVNGTDDNDVNGSLRSLFLMTNLYYDFNVKWHDIQPFVSAGLGIAYQHGNLRDDDTPGISSSGSSTDVAWQLGAGARYRATPQLAFTGGYRYLGAGDAQIGHNKLSYGNHEIRLGLEYDLPVLPGK